MLVVASLGLGMRIVTELTVLELRDCMHLCPGCGRGTRVDNDELMRGVATTVAHSLSWIG